MKINGSSRIEFYRFKLSVESDEHGLYNLVRLDTLDTLKVDKKLKELLRLLESDKTVQEAADEINFSVHSTLMMLKILEEGHFIKTVDGEKLDDVRHKIKPEIRGKSKIEFHRLRISSQPDEHNLYGIVRWDTDDTLRVDKNVIELVRQLKDGKTVQEAAHEIGFSMQVVEMVLKMLDDANFFKAIDGVELEDTGKVFKPWFAKLDPKWFRWLLFKPLLISLFLFGVTGIISGFFVFGVPNYKSFFWTTDVFTVFVSLFIADIFLTFIHESAHFLFTKAVGGEAVMRINYRYIYIVAETESFHLGVVPKRLRYLVYLSGSMLDIILSGLFYWLLLISAFYGMQLGSLHQLLIAIILMQLISFLWQLNVFLETDLYNFVSDYLGIENLRSDAVKYIVSHTKHWKKIALFPIKKILMFFSANSSSGSDDLRLLTKQERKKLLIYVFILILGIIFITLEFLFIELPRDLIFITQAASNLLEAFRNMQFIDILKSMLMISIILLNYLMLIILKFRETSHRRKRLRF